jgi:hypothetical protein
VVRERSAQIRRAIDLHMTKVRREVEITNDLLRSLIEHLTRNGVLGEGGRAAEHAATIRNPRPRRRP